MSSLCIARRLDSVCKNSCISIFSCDVIDTCFDAQHRSNCFFALFGILKLKSVESRILPPLIAFYLFINNLYLQNRRQ